MYWDYSENPKTELNLPQTSCSPKTVEAYYKQMQIEFNL